MVALKCADSDQSARSRMLDLGRAQKRSRRFGKGEKDREKEWRGSCGHGTFWIINATAPPKAAQNLGRHITLQVDED